MPVRRIEVTDGTKAHEQSLTDLLIGGSVVLMSVIAVVWVLYYR